MALRTTGESSTTSARIDIKLSSPRSREHHRRVRELTRGLTLARGLGPIGFRTRHCRRCSRHPLLRACPLKPLGQACGLRDKLPGAEDRFFDLRSLSAHLNALTYRSECGRAELEAGTLKRVGQLANRFDIASDD